MAEKDASHLLHLSSTLILHCYRGAICRGLYRFPVIVIKRIPAFLLLVVLAGVSMWRIRSAWRYLVSGKIETLDEWAALAVDLHEDGYNIWQMQYAANKPPGFHVWFWKQEDPKKSLSCIT